MNQSISEALILQKFKGKESVNSSELKNKNIVDWLMGEKVIKKSKNIGKKGYIYTKLSSFESYVERRYSNSLEEYISTNKRSKLEEIAGDDKSRTLGSQKGYFLSSCDSINLEEGIKVNTVEGSSLFIHQDVSIVIPENIIVVGIENFEPLLSPKKLKKLINTNKPTLFIYRNESMRKLLKILKNEFLYFPDYDIPGIKIYETEILSRKKDSKLFIPNNFKSSLEQGNSQRYHLHNEDSVFKTYVGRSKEGTFAINMIRDAQRVLSQEFFIV